MDNERDATTWFKSDPDNKEDYLVSSKGILLLALQYTAEEENPNTRKLINRVIGLAKQKGYKGENMLNSVLSNHPIEQKLLVWHVNEICGYVDEETIMNLTIDLKP